MKRSYLKSYKGKVFPTQVPTLQREFKKPRRPVRSYRPTLPPPNTMPYYQGHGAVKS